MHTHTHTPHTRTSTSSTSLGSLESFRDIVAMLLLEVETPERPAVTALMGPCTPAMIADGSELKIGFRLRLVWRPFRTDSPRRFRFIRGSDSDSHRRHCYERARPCTMKDMTGIVIVGALIAQLASAQHGVDPFAGVCDSVTVCVLTHPCISLSSHGQITS